MQGSQALVVRLGEAVIYPMAHTSYPLSTSHWDDLEVEYKIPQHVMQQVLPWFRKVRTNSKHLCWEMNVNKVVRQISMGQLMLHKVCDSSHMHAPTLSPFTE